MLLLLALYVCIESNTSGFLSKILNALQDLSAVISFTRDNIIPSSEAAPIQSVPNTSKTNEMTFISVPGDLIDGYLIASAAAFT